MDSETRAADFVLFYAKVRSFPEDSSCKLKRACRRAFCKLAKAKGLRFEKNSLELPAEQASLSTGAGRGKAPYNAFYWAVRGTDKAWLEEAERLRMQLPLKNYDQTPLALLDELPSDCGSCCSCLEPEDTDFGQEHPLNDKRLDLVTAPFTWSKRHLFYGGVKDPEFGDGRTFPLTGAQRIYLTYSILERIDVQGELQAAQQPLLCSADCIYCRSLERRVLERLPIVLEHLLNAKVFVDAFTTHDAEAASVEDPGSSCCIIAGEKRVHPEVLEEIPPMAAGTPAANRKLDKPPPTRRGPGLRGKLDQSWRCGFRYQPLRLIKMYFGEKLGFYYAWMGHMVAHLSLLAVIGLAFFIYGIIYASSNYKSEAAKLMIQLLNSSVNFTDGNAFTINLVDMMQFIRLTFENQLTIPFGCILSLWNQVAIRSWKKYEATLSQRWGMKNHQLAEPPKSAVAPRQRVQNPYRRCLGVSTVFVFFVAIALGVTVSFQVAKLVASRSGCKGDSQVACIFLSVILPILGHLLLMGVLDLVYSHVAKIITKMENHKFQSDHDASYALKAFSFRFANNFSSLFHIAFARQENVVFGELSDICSQKNIDIDCFNLLSVYTSGYIIGKSLLKLIVDSIKHNSCIKRVSASASTPLRRCFGSFCKRVKRAVYTAELDTMAALERQLRNQHPNGNGTGPTHQLSQERDMDSERSPDDLTDEYLEKTILHGYIVLFGSSNYLTPLVILIPILVDLHLDARHLVRKSRRPVPVQAGGVGIWNKVHEFLGHAGILHTGGILAFTSSSLRVHGADPSVTNKLALFTGFTGGIHLMKFFMTACLNGRASPLKMREKWEHHNVDSILDSEKVPEDALDTLKDLQSSDRWFHVVLPCFVSLEQMRPEAGPFQV